MEAIRSELAKRDGITNVAAGSYYIVTSVYWTPTGDAFLPEGGLLMEPVTVARGQAAQVILAGN